MKKVLYAEVKPLEFTTCEETLDGSLFANYELGYYLDSYEIMPDGDTYIVTFPENTKECEPLTKQVKSLEKAKALCQKHFEKIVKSFIKKHIEHVSYHYEEK